MLAVALALTWALQCRFRKYRKIFVHYLREPNGAVEQLVRGPSERRTRCAASAWVGACGPRKERRVSHTKMSAGMPLLLLAPLPLRLVGDVVASLASRNGFLDMLAGAGAGGGGAGRRTDSGKVAPCGDGDAARLRKGLLEEKTGRRLGEGCRSAAGRERGFC